MSNEWAAVIIINRIYKECVYSFNSPRSGIGVEIWRHKIGIFFLCEKWSLPARCSKVGLAATVHQVNFIWFLHIRIREQNVIWNYCRPVQSTIQELITEPHGLFEVLVRSGQMRNAAQMSIKTMELYKLSDESIPSSILEEQIDICGWNFILQYLRYIHFDYSWWVGVVSSKVHPRAFN